MLNLPWPEIMNQLAYIRPVYLPEGDVTEVADARGNTYVDKRNIRSVKRAICRHFALDYLALRKIYREQWGSGIAPLVLAPGYVLVAVKTRSARCDGDPCYGFINIMMVSAVEKSVQEGTRAEVRLKNSLAVSCVNGVQTIKNAINKAKSLENKFYPEEKQRTAGLAELFQCILNILQKENNGS